MLRTTFWVLTLAIVGAGAALAFNAAPTPDRPQRRVQHYYEASGDSDAAEARTWHRVHATREGLVGETTATGHVIREDSVFVALPARRALGRRVEVRYGGKSVVCEVRDLGPWSWRDDYWNHPRPPAAELGRRVPDTLTQRYGRPTNGAGIDLSDGLWDKLGIVRGRGVVEVRWRFVKKRD